jgi:hypothetical protein
VFREFSGHKPVLKSDGYYRGQYYRYYRGQVLSGSVLSGSVLAFDIIMLLSGSVLAFDIRYYRGQVTIGVSSCI